MEKAKNKMIKIAEDMKEILSNDENYKEWDSCRVITCYYLLKLKREPLLRSVDLLRENVFNRENIKFGAEVYDDIFEYLTDYPLAWDKMYELIDKYSEEELIEYINKNPYLYESVEELPLGIASLVEKILNIKGNEDVLQININAGEFALDISERYPNAKVVAYDESNTLLANVATYADSQKLDNLIFIGEPDEEKYDKVFVCNMINPSTQIWRNQGAFDGYLSSEMQDLSNISREWGGCGLALDSIRANGKVVALMNAGQLNVKETKKARQLLCERGMIEGIIILPNKMYEDTWINPFIVIFGKNNKKVRLYDASKEYQAERIKGKKIHTLTENMIDKIVDNYRSGKDVVIVDIETLRQSDYNLNPLRYDTNFEDSGYIELGSIIKNVKRGATLTAAEMDRIILEDKSQIKCIIPSSLSRGIVTSYMYYHGEVKKNNKNETRRGDLLINKSGSPFKVAIARDNYYVVGNIYILDLDTSKVSVEYIRCYLMSQRGQDEIKKYSVGQTTPIVSVANLYKIRIPVYDSEKQEILNIRCKDVVNKIEESFEQIANNEKEIEFLFD